MIEGKSISVVEKRERRSARIHIRATKERIHPTLKITSNGTSILCRKKGWKEANGLGL